MTKPQQNRGEIAIYRPKGGAVFLKVKLYKETIWLTQAQIAKLFDVERSVITKHARNVFKSRELNKDSVCAKIAHTAVDGKIYQTNFYNLDAIIAVGYRVNSKQATQFRIWATKVIKDYIIKGYTFNQQRIKQLRSARLKDLERAINLIKKTIEIKQLTVGGTSGLLKVISDYASSWLLLYKYDQERLEIKKTTKAKYYPNYKEAWGSIVELKNNLIKEKQATEIFGQERRDSFQAIIGNINQTFDGKELYPSVEEKAAHFLYFVIKDHPFIDGNKRIGAFLFIVFLAKNKYLFKTTGERKINDNALVALALLIAESNPKEKDIFIKLIINFLQK